MPEMVVCIEVPEDEGGVVEVVVHLVHWGIVSSGTAASRWDVDVANL